MLGRKKSSITIAADIDRAKSERAEAQATLHKLEAARSHLIRSGSDAELDDHERAVAKATRAVERATAVEADLHVEHSRATEAEEQARRQKLYDAGRTALAEYERLARQEYVAAAQTIAYTLVKMDALCPTIAAANDALPTGATPLDPECFRRPVPVKHVDRYETREFWIDADGYRYTPIIVDDVLCVSSGSTQHTERVKVVAPPTPPRPIPKPLQQSVNLPAVLPDNADYWTPSK